MPGMPSFATRRRVLHALCLLPAVAAWPRLVAAAPTAPRRLAFYHTHTAERLEVVYREGGQYLPDALATVNHYLRDFRSGDTHPIDPALLDVLSDVQSLTGREGRFEVISAYRSPHTNAMLASRSGGVADRSLHIQGQAIDVRLPGLKTSELRRAALQLRAGGVGYYPGSDFVHLDTGRVRSW